LLNTLAGMSANARDAEATGSMILATSAVAIRIAFQASTRPLSGRPHSFVNRKRFRIVLLEGPEVLATQEDDRRS
jgi:hypothetical protein